MTGKVSQAFTFTADIEKQIIAIATINAGLTIEREDNIIALFALLGYDGSARNIPGKEWERIQTVYADAAAKVTHNTADHEKKAFRRAALALGYGKLQTAEAKLLQDARKAAKPATVAATTDSGASYGKATQTILAAIIAIDNGNPQAARELLVTMVPAKALTLTAPVTVAA